MKADELRGRLAGAERWESRSDGWWLTDGGIDVRHVAALMMESGARLVTLTARPIAEPQASQTPCRYLLYYHWDLEGMLLTVGTVVGESVPSIFDLCPAADWVERELHDYFGICFAGREELAPLVTREGDPSVFGAPASENGRGNGVGRAGGAG